MADPTAKERAQYAKSGWAMPDGSYYIRPGHPQDLSNAIMAVGRAAGQDGTSDEQQREAVRRHIMARAKALGKEDQIPATWQADGSLKAASTTATVTKHSDYPEVDDFLEHFGVKGMHWGVRKDRGSESGGHSKSSGKAPSVAEASADAKKASELAGKVSTGGTKSLSNKELQDLVTRMNLESQYSKLSTPDVKKGQTFLQKYNQNTTGSITAIKSTAQIAKFVAPFIVAAAAGAAAKKAGSNYQYSYQVPRHKALT